MSSDLSSIYQHLTTRASELAGEPITDPVTAALTIAQKTGETFRTALPAPPLGGANVLESSATATVSPIGIIYDTIEYKAISDGSIVHPFSEADHEFSLIIPELETKGKRNTFTSFTNAYAAHLASVPAAPPPSPALPKPVGKPPLAPVLTAALIDKSVASSSRRVATKAIPFLMEEPPFPVEEIPASAAISLADLIGGVTDRSLAAAEPLTMPFINVSSVSLVETEHIASEHDRLPTPPDAAGPYRVPLDEGMRFSLRVSRR